MKWIRMSIALVVLVLLTGSWGGNAAAGEGIVRQGVLVPYEITGPVGWSYQAEPHQFVLGVFRPEGDGMFPYISMTMMGGKFQTMREELSQYSITPEQLVEANLYSRPGARLLSSRWLGEEDARFLLTEFTWSSVFGEVRSIKAFHPWRGTVIVATATCLAVEYDEYQQVFLDSVMSVRIKKYRDLEE